MMSSSALMAQGDVRAALADSQRGFELARAIRDPQLLHSGLEIHARALLLDGQRREAEGARRQSSSRSRPSSTSGSSRTLPWLVLDLGREQEYAGCRRSPCRRRRGSGGRCNSGRDVQSPLRPFTRRIGAKGSEAIARLHAAEALAPPRVSVRRPTPSSRRPSRSSRRRGEAVPAPLRKLSSRR